MPAVEKHEIYPVVHSLDRFCLFHFKYVPLRICSVQNIGRLVWIFFSLQNIANVEQTDVVFFKIIFNDVKKIIPSNCFILFYQELEYIAEPGYLKTVFSNSNPFPLHLLSRAILAIFETRKK